MLSKDRSLKTKFARRLEVEALECRDLPATGFSTAVDPYLLPIAAGTETKALLTVGDTVKDVYTANGAALPDYRMVGIPDGLGAFDNGDGTFTVLMNHELGSTQGGTRDHGSKGAFVSRWVIDKASLTILEGDDLIKTIKLWDPTANSGAGGYVTNLDALEALN